MFSLCSNCRCPIQWRNLSDLNSIRSPRKLLPKARRHSTLPAQERRLGRYIHRSISSNRPTCHGVEDAELIQNSSVVTRYVNVLYRDTSDYVILRCIIEWFRIMTGDKTVMTPGTSKLTGRYWNIGIVNCRVVVVETRMQMRNWLVMLRFGTSTTQSRMQTTPEKLTTTRKPFRWPVSTQWQHCDSVVISLTMGARLSWPS